MTPSVSAANQIIANFIADNSDLKRLQNLLCGQKCWLVGGTIRDLLLGHSPGDVDIACAFNPTPLAKKWSKIINAHWFWLDKERQQSRVITPGGASFDFAPLRADDILEDLRLRDFTINAMAFSLNADMPGEGAGLIDPLDGAGDLRQGVVQRCYEGSFTDDPLRMLKGVRHAVTLGFKIADNSLAQIKAEQPLLSKVAGERIQAELEKILLADNIEAGIRLMSEGRLFEALFGVECCEGKAAGIGKAVANFAGYVKQFHQADHFGLILGFLFIRLAVKNATKLAVKRLKLSKDRQVLISQLVKGVDSEIDLSCYGDQFTHRQKALFYECFQPSALGKIIYSNYRAGQLSIPDVSALHAAFSELERSQRIPHLISGHDIMAICKGISCKAVGVYQQAIKAAEITGEIQTSSDAKDWLKKQNID